MTPVLQPSIYRKEVELKTKQAERPPDTIKVMLGSSTLAKKVKEHLERQGD